MSDGNEIGGRFKENPIGSDAPRGKNRERRKHKLDGPTLTPTERHIKNNLMRQFMRTGEGSGGRSAAYINSPVWCTDCARRMKVDGHEKCEGCLYRDYCNSTSQPTVNGFLKIFVPEKIQ